MELQYETNILRKESMSTKEYYIKMKPLLVDLPMFMTI